MSTKVGLLTIEMAANIARLETDMRRARNTVDNTMRSISRSASMAMSSIQGLIGVMSVRELAQISDQFKTINATLALATRSAEAGAVAYEQVLDIAMRSGQAIEGVAVTYRRFAENSRDLGITQDQVAKATETVSQALALSGGSYQSTQAALMQFSQALASGTLRGQELNSVLEQAPRLARLIADGMNVSVGSLRSLAEKGKITSDVIIKALEDQASTIEREFGQLPMTFARAVNNFQTAVTDLVGNVEKNLGIFGALAGVINLIAQNLSLLVNVAIAAAITAMGRLTVTVVSLISTKIALAASMGAATAATITFNRALAVLGGPAGAVITATSAAYAFRSELGLVSKEYAKAITATDEFNEGIKATGGFWSALLMLGTTNPFTSLEDQVSKYRVEVEKLKEEKLNLNKVQQAFLDTAARLEKAQIRLTYFEALLATQTRASNQARQDAASGADAHTSAYTAMIASADELVAKMHEEFSLIGLTNEERAVSIAMRKLEELGIRSGTEAFEKYLKEIIEIQRRIRVKKEWVQLADDSAKAAKRESEEYDRLITTLKEKIATIEMENQTFGLTNRERERSIFLRELENVKIQDRNALLEKYDEATLIKEANDLREKSTKERLEKEKDYAKEVEKINDQIGQSLTDALMQGGVTAKDFLLNMFKTMILRPMLQPIITGFVGAFTSTAMASGAAGVAEGATGGTVGTSLGLVGMANSLKSAYQMVTDGFAQIGSMASTAVSTFEAASAYGTGLFSQQTAMLAAQEAGMSSLSAAAGTAATALAGIGAGLGIGNLISGGKGLGGGSSWLSVGGATAAGAAIGSVVPVLGTALGAAIGGIVGGLANAAFGTGKKEIDDTGIKVRFNAMKTTIDAYEEWSKKGGFISGGDDGVDISAVDKSLQKYFDTAVAATAINVKRYADVLGLSAAGISDFTFEVKQSLAGLSPEEAQKEIDRIITAYGNAMASVVTSEIGPVLREGEEAGVALARLASSLNAVNTVFGTLNLNLMETSIYGADAASKLLDFFGGIEEFTKATDYYYQNFYSTQERVAKTTEQLTDVFAQLGYELPSSRAAFRSLIESVQAASNPSLFAALIQLAPAFNDLAIASEQLLASGGSIMEVAGFVSSVDSAFASLKETIDRELKTALDGLQRGYESLIKTLDLQKQTAEAAKSVAEESLTAINSVFDVIKEQVSSILSEVLPAQTAAQGAAFISDALLAAQTTGYLPESNALSSAIAAARTGLGVENFSSSFDAKLANMRLVGQLNGIQDIAGEQKSVAELQLESATKQLEALDAQIEQANTQYDADVAATQAYYDNQLQMAQNQVNELRGINGTMMTMTHALAAFGAAVNAERAASISSSNDRTAAISQMYIDILRRAPDAAGLSNWVSSGMSLDEVRAGILGSQEAQGFAEGGRYPGGLAMVGERGPELINFSNPGMVYTAAQTQSLLGGAGGSEIAQEVRSLREENKVQARSIVRLNLRMARVLERWDGDGLPTERVETV